MLRSWTENLEGPPGVLQKEGKDVFGRNPPKVASDVLLCENCNQKIAASRFAQHLSKCMGVGGRTGSREASKRASARMQQFAEEQEHLHTVPWTLASNPLPQPWMGCTLARKDKII